MMFHGIYFGLGLIFFVILTIESFASAAPPGSIDFAAIPGFAAIRDAYCHDKGLDPAAEGSANCRCYWEFAGSNKIMLKDILPKACEKISSYEYGFDAYASRVIAPIPPTLIMAEYNREFRGEACKGPRRMTQEQCEKNFRNATWYVARTMNIYCALLMLRTARTAELEGLHSVVASSTPLISTQV